MAITQNTYTGDGTTVLFSFTFPYLKTTDIKVSLDSSETIAYTLANATTIQFNTAPANGVAIRIYRDTDDTDLDAEFFPGSAIRSQDLNDNFDKVLYIAQETKNLTVQASTGNLADGSITNNLLANNAVTASKITDNSVTGAKLVDGSIGTAKLADGSVTAAKLSTSYLPTAGGTLTGTVTFAAGQTFPIAGNTVTVTAVSKTLINLERCTVTASGQTITLPASPQAGWEVTVLIAGSFEDTVIARNGANIMNLAEDMTIDRADSSVTLFYVDATRGWRII